MATINPSSALTPSNVRLSSATAVASQGAILLNFSGALDATSEGNANYRVRVNSVVIPIGSASYSDSRVTLSGLFLNAGDRVELRIGELRDASGQKLAGGTLQVLAR